MIGTHFYDLNQECSTVIEPEYDEFGNLKSSEKIIEHLRKHIIPLDNAKREYDAGIFDYEFFTLENEDIKRYKEKFDRNYGTFCDGKMIKFNNSEYYFKFTSNIAIAMDAGIKHVDENQKLFSLLSLYDRSIKQFPTLSVFINGIKIPDKVVYVYMADTCTDILIPEKYLKKIDETNYEKMEIYVQKHIYLANKYFSSYQKLSNTRQLFVDIKSLNINNQNFDFKKISMIYSNGLYKPQDSYQITRMNDVLTFTFNDSYLVDDNIEIIFDFDIKSINVTRIEGDNTQYASLIRCFFNLKESTVDYKRNFLFGSLPKKNCYFFINSKRIPLNRIRQVGRMNYIYENIEVPDRPYTCTIIYTDKDHIDESKNYIYGEDYYLSNFCGMDNISSTLNKLIDNEPLNESEDFMSNYLINPSVDFLKLINKNDNMYSREYFEEFFKLTDIYLDYESQTRNLIKKAGNYLIRDFMNLFGKNDLYLEINKDQNTPELLSYSFSTKKDEYTDTTKFYYLLDINGNHVPSNKYEITSNFQYIHINIPSSLLKEGKNRIHIRENKYDTGTVNNVEFRLIHPSSVLERAVEFDETDYDALIEELNNEMNEILNNKITEESKNRYYEIKTLINTYKNAQIANYKYYYTFNKFNTASDIKDYLCLKYIYNEENYYYSDERNQGWIIENETTFIQNADGTVTLLMRNIPSENFVIYSKRFSFKFHKMINKNLETLEDMSIVVDGDDSYGLPIIPNGSFIVFLNGERLYNGIDYVFRHPGNYNLITYTSLCLKRKTKLGDEIDIYFDSVQNTSVGRSNNVLAHTGAVWNKYGLIYFGNLKYPYSPKYIDLYVNGKYIYPDQIDILSDKLIRIDPEIQNPMYDIFAESSFNVDIEKLKYYFDYEGNEYEDSDFEKYIGQLFVEFDFSTITNPDENALGTRIYETFDDNVDSWYHIPNERRADDSNEAMRITNELVSKRYNLYESAYLLWLKSNGVKTLMKPNENIRQDIMNYFRFYLEDSILTTRQDIVISSKTTKTFNDIVFDSSKYPFDHSDRVRRMLKFAKGNSINSKEIYEKLRDQLPISNALYPRDFPKFISSKTKISQINRDIVIGGVPSNVYSNTTSHIDYNGGQ